MEAQHGQNRRNASFCCEGEVYSLSFRPVHGYYFPLFHIEPMSLNAVFCDLDLDFLLLSHFLPIPSHILTTTCLPLSSCKRVCSTPSPFCFPGWVGCIAALFMCIWSVVPHVCLYLQGLMWLKNSSVILSLRVTGSQAIICSKRIASFEILQSFPTRMFIFCY